MPSDFEEVHRLRRAARRIIGSKRIVPLGQECLEPAWTAKHAANLLGLERASAARQRAKRRGWRREGTGNQTKYLLADVLQR